MLGILLQTLDKKEADSRPGSPEEKYSSFGTDKQRDRSPTGPQRAGSATEEYA